MRGPKDQSSAIEVTGVEANSNAHPVLCAWVCDSLEGFQKLVVGDLWNAVRGKQAIRQVVVVKVRVFSSART